MVDVTFKITDNTRRIENILIRSVKINHKRILDTIADLARNGAPVDTGALAASIYVTGPWGSDYEAAVTRASAAPGTRIVERGQIAPPLVLNQPGDRGAWLGAVDIPLTYVIFVHQGYYHILAQKIMPANPFLLRAFNARFRDFMRLCKSDFDRTLTVAGS